MHKIDPASDLQHDTPKRRQTARQRRVLNTLPLAHRLAARVAVDEPQRERLLGQAMVGLLEAVDSFDPSVATLRFGAYAEPHIIRALERTPDAREVRTAQAEVAAAISSRQRVRELAGFLGVPVEALVGALTDVTDRERVLERLPRPIRGAA
jgi:DNA-directed RNA polymerase specialized sigma subunit